MFFSFFKLFGILIFPTTTENIIKQKHRNSRVETFMASDYFYQK